MVNEANARSCRDEASDHRVWQVARYEDGTPKPQDRASWTLTTSAHQADIDHGIWSNHRRIHAPSRLILGCWLGAGLNRAIQIGYSARREPV